MSVLNNATKHFKEQLTSGLKSIEVPEWETTIYFKPATPFAVEQKIIALHAKGELVEALVETLLAKALDEDGKRVFKPADKPVLMNEVDPNIIIRIATVMNGGREEAQAELGN